ncbi:MAG TPA: serine hydrolase [Pyrinomonadaceae bacterium]|nr:serine hydrolase [Pyrinomonadaceae bacterium]
MNCFAALLLLACAAAPSGAQTTPATATPAAAPTPAPTPPAWLDARVRSEVAAFSGNVSLFAKNLDTGATYSLNGDERVRTASTIKVAVMVEAFARVAEGRAKWTDELVLTKAGKVSGAGILPELSDGLRLSLRDAVNLMMILSDNTATNLAVDLLTADAVNARMESLGFRDIRLMRKIGGGGESREGRVEANKRFGLGRATPREMVLLLEKLERGEVVSPEASKEMLDLMKREQGRNGIGRALSGTPKATKSGALDRLRSDVGVIYTKRGRIAMAITVDDMPEIIWTPDNPAFLLMSRLSLILVDGLGNSKP